MNIKEFTESVITAYLEKGGEVCPDITLHLFQFIENDKSLLSEYNALKSHYEEVNPMMGQTLFDDDEEFEYIRSKKTIVPISIKLSDYAKEHSTGNENYQFISGHGSPTSVLSHSVLQTCNAAIPQEHWCTGNAWPQPFVAKYPPWLF